MARQKKADNGKHKKPIEQYEHRDKKRVNNPPVGLVTAATEPPKAEKKTYAYDPHLDPQLVWAGKAEHTSFEVPTVSLHVHERIDPRTIIEAVRKRNGNGQAVQGSLFESREENPPLREAIDFYKHAHNWSNRLIAGDSLLVMNSLLEKEGMAGQVQMVYMDPPYGIKYGSNFQPFVNKRDVKDGKDEDLTQEPEMIRAFRDTWELGIHSYLTYLRDRLCLAKELLHETGSCFVQIGEDNLHLVRNQMDEVFGADNFMSVVTYRAKNMPFGAKYLENMYDHLIWYAKQKDRVKFRRAFMPRPTDPAEFSFVQEENGSRRKLTETERDKPELLPSGARLFSRLDMYSSGYTPTCIYDFEFEGTLFKPETSKSWKTTKEGMIELGRKGRLMKLGSKLYYIFYFDDYPLTLLTNFWNDTAGGFSEAKAYVVQTHPKVIQRCMLLTTDPSDLVFDPTCGSGTTSYVAEQWGRRWLTCDTSRVAITLAKQRLMSAHYDYYELAHPEEGVSSGFRYKTVPHITVGSLANNEPPGVETLYDQPFVDSSRARVTGPFTVEAVPAPTVRSLIDVDAGLKPGATVAPPFRAARGEDVGLRTDEQNAGLKPGATFGPVEAAQIRLDGTADPQQMRLANRPITADASIARSGESLRQIEWRDVLLQGGVRGKGGQVIQFSRVEPLGGTRWLHADAETKGVKPERVVISFGPEYAPLDQRQVELAWEEARQLHPRPSILLFVYTDIDPEAGKDIGELTREKTGLTFLGAKIDADVWTKDLKKKARTSPSAWLVGQPDIEVRRVGAGLAPPSSGRGHAPTGSIPNQTGRAGQAPPLQYEVEVRGFDYFNTKTGLIESGDTSKIAMWLLDTDYDGRSLFPRQVFFPMAGDDEGWARLAKNLKAEIDPELIEAFRGTVSLPFAVGVHKRAAVKIVDDRGIESLKIVELD